RAEGGIDLSALSADSLRERRLDFLERFVDFRLKVRAARAAGYDQDSSYLDEIENYRDDLAGPYFTDAEILDGIIRDLYDKGQEEIEVSHLLLLANDETPPEDTLASFAAIQAIRDSIVTGQLTFREAAINNSEDPSVSRPEGQIGSGGDLNWLTAGRTVLPFEDAMYETPVGSVSEPVRSQYGYHLVYVTGRRPTPSEISASHILIRWPGDTAEDSAAVYNQIGAIQQRLASGESFDALATELSEDPGSAVNGGDLGTFGPGRMVPPFEAAAYALEAPGDVSEPVETRFGVHLIQLTGITPRPTFEEQYDDLKRQAQGLPRTSLKRLEVGREERVARGAEFFPDVIRQALAGLETDSTLVLAARGFGSAAADTFATLDGTAFTLDDLGLRVRGARINPGDDPVEAIVEFADETLTTLAVEAAIGSLEERNPEFARLFQGYAQGVLLFRIAEDSVWTRASEDSLGLQRVYDANRSAYQWPERRRVLAFRTPSDSLLRAVTADLDAGMAPE
ncbi:MAG: peptidylprolyl isomerase, partial [Bacteroidota bacterium]